MRTTVMIDDELLRRAKKRAAEAGVSLSEVVNRALREAFDRRVPADPQTPFRMLTFGRGQRPVDHHPADLARVTDEEDLAGLRGASG